MQEASLGKQSDLIIHLGPQHQLSTYWYQSLWLTQVPLACASQVDCNHFGNSSLEVCIAAKLLRGFGSAELLRTNLWLNCPRRCS